jgi:hypothetical protein
MLLTLSNNSKSIENWQTVLSQILLNFENDGNQKLQELWTAAQNSGDQEAMAVVQVFAEPVTPEPESSEEKEEEGWLQGFLRLFRPKTTESVAPPPICAISQDNWSTAVLRAEMRRPRARYVNPF